MGLSGIALAPLMVDIKADVAGFKNDMSKASTAGVVEAKKISKELANVTKVGENLSKVGGNLTKFVSVPIAGLGLAVGKMAVDFESDFAKVSTLLDSSKGDFNTYKKDILKASSDSKVAVGEFSDAVYESISAGVDQSRAVGFTTEAMKLAKGGFTTGAKAVDVMTTAINGYKLKTEDATRIADLLTTTQNLGKTTVDELASSMGSVIPIASAANYGIEELSAAYALMTKNGIATSEAGTYVKSMLGELTTAGSKSDKVLRDLSGKGFADLKKEGTSTTEILAKLTKHAEENGMSLKDMFGSTEAGSAAMVLASGAGAEYDEMLKAMGISAGATQAAFEKIDASPAEQMKGAINKMKNAGIELGIALVPAFTKIAEVISGLAEKFSGLSSEQQENMLKWGAIALVVGPVLKMVGGGIQTFASFKSILGGTTKALGLFETGTAVAGAATTTLTTTAGAAAGATGIGGLLVELGGMAVVAAPFVAGAVVIGAAAYGIHKTMSEDVIPTVDLFADKVEYTTAIVGNGYSSMATTTQVETTKISEATQTAVQAYVDMDDNVTKALYSQKINQEVVTTEMATSMIGQFNAMGETIKTSQATKFTEMNTDLTNFFVENSSLTEIREAQVLAKTQESHNAQQATVDASMKRITEIYTTAKNENRQLKESELTEIGSLQEQMKNNAVSTLSQTEQEAAVIKQRMKDYQGRLSAEMASEMITKANEARDGEISAANEKYDGIVKQASRLKEAGYITDTEYDDMITKAKETKEEQITKAGEACEGVRKEIENATPGISREVDLQTGEIKNGYDRAWDSIKGFFDWLFTSNAEASSNAEKVGTEAGNGYDGYHYNGLNYVPFDGYVARLHKGERVLTANENKEVNQGSGIESSDVNVINNFYGKVESPYEVAKASKKAMKDLRFA
ncbi:phage tail tape measure protein [Clostridium gasigenes]|uniref:Phage tail tape measure protein, TP901 family, core region n=1 Tax=Clostridium gasigenes TaxID=94869 RepID=A0A1H0M8C3_9CLOT|nr:phage tail tape measure protein [Clostridium gasigenes]SDO76664.1 phage tail tape measure protein, TP901 family, core region [Clostridium gasigenes]